MTIFLVQEFFNEAQRTVVANAIVGLVVTFVPVAQALALYFAHGLSKRLGKVERNQEVNGGKIDRINERRGARATDAYTQAGGNMPEMQLQRDVQRHDEPANNEELARRATSAHLHRGEPRAASDPDDHISIKDVF